MVIFWTTEDWFSGVRKQCLFLSDGTYNQKYSLIFIAHSPIEESDTQTSIHTFVPLFCSPKLSGAKRDLFSSVEKQAVRQPNDLNYANLSWEDQRTARQKAAAKELKLRPIHSQILTFYLTKSIDSFLGM